MGQIGGNAPHPDPKKMMNVDFDSRTKRTFPRSPGPGWWQGSRIRVGARRLVIRKLDMKFILTNGQKMNRLAWCNFDSSKYPHQKRINWQKEDKQNHLEWGLHSLGPFNNAKSMIKCLNFELVYNVVYFWIPPKNITTKDIPMIW